MDPTPSPPRNEELLVHGRFLRGLARGLVSDPERAEDLLQETWTAALQHPPSHGRAPRAWLARILRGLAIKRGMRESERAGRESRAVSERETQRPDTIAAEIELSRRVFESVERLREPYRSTLYLRYYRDLAPQAIAGELGLPVKTVKTRLTRGLEILREDLDRQHGGRRESWVALLLPLARGGALPPVPSVPARAFPPFLAVPVAIATLVAGLLALSFFLDQSEERAADGAERVPAHAPAASAAAVPLRAPENARIPLRPDAAARRSAAEDVRLRGRVLDLLGEPVLGAAVRVVYLGGDRREPSRRPLALHGDPDQGVRTTSDAQGAFQLRLEHAGLIRLSIEHRGHAPIGRRSLVFLGQELDLGTFVLDPGVILSGRVLDPRGAPLAGAEVWQQRSDEGLIAGPELVHLERVAETDADGRFELDRQALGSWRLEARMSRLAPATASGATSRPGERTQALVLQMAAGMTLRGRVLGLETDRIAHVSLLARTRGAPEEEPLRAALDARGGFELEGLEAGTELELVPVSSERGENRALAKARRVRVGAGHVELVVEPVAALDSRRRAWPARGAPAAPGAAEWAGSVEIRVATQDGAPAAGALVAHRRADPGPRAARPSEIRAADPDGRLEWSGLEEGRHEFRVVDGVFGFEVDAGGAWQMAGVSAAVEGPGVPTLVLGSLPTVELRGSVALDGEPLVRAELLLRPARELEPGAAGVRPFDPRRPAGPSLLVRSDGEGRFVFRGLQRGEYHLELFHPQRALPETRELTLDAPEQDLVLELASTALCGVVRTREGLPLARASVRALSMRGESPRPFGRSARDPASECGPDGGFTLLGLEPGRPVRLEVTCEGYATRETRSAPPESFQEVLLEPEAVLALELAGEPQAFLLLRARGPEDATRTTGVVPGETTRLSGLSEGTWHLELFDGGPRGVRGPSPLGAREILLVPGENRLRWDVP